MKILQWGFGAMGSGMVRQLLQRDNVELVGVIDANPALLGKDIAEVLDLGNKTGVIISDDPAAALQNLKPDVTLLATGSFVDEVFEPLKMIMEAGSNAITIAEEMAFTWRMYPEQSQQLDTIAQKNGVTLLGTGINPGFVLDLLVLVLTGVCGHVDRISAARINDLSPFGPTVMRTQGVGTSPEEFAAGVEKNTIVGHIGFQQSIAMIAAALGWELDEIKETKEAIVSKTHRESKYIKVEPGMVAGCRQRGYGIINGKTVIEMDHPQQIQPEKENVFTGDYIKIDGDMHIDMSMKPEIPGGLGTINVAVNMIPQVFSARPGLLSMVDLPIPYAWKSLR